MKIVKFLDKTWDEIPEQDNPGLAGEECIMIYRGKNFNIRDGGFVVSIIPTSKVIERLGVFWAAENAELFAEMLAENKLDGTSKYKCVIYFNDEYIEIFNITVSDIQNGFWVDSNFKFTKESDGKYWMHPSSVCHVEKLDD